MDPPESSKNTLAGVIGLDPSVWKVKRSITPLMATSSLNVSPGLLVIVDGGRPTRCSKGQAGIQGDAKHGRRADNGSLAQYCIHEGALF
jgi:hypothetical protein